MNVKPIRDRAHHFLEPSVAAYADLTLKELEDFVAGARVLSLSKLARLAKRMGLSESDIAA
jgi:hypothetical protein